MGGAEGQFEQMLVNPPHIQAVPGRKSDATDREWITDLHQHGLPKGSLVPPTPIQGLRDLACYRAELLQGQNRAANRIQKFLEQANLKLSSKASNALGVSGRRMLEAIMAGQDDAEQLAKMARGKLKNKIPELEQALERRFRDHYHPRRGSGDGLQLGGRDRRGHMNQFPTAQHLASWAALFPGHHESAGKRKCGKTRDGNRWFRRSLYQAAWAVTRKQDRYLSAQFKRLAARRGVKWAVMAVSPRDADHRLPHAEDRPRLLRTRRELSGADQQAPASAVFTRNGYRDSG